MSRALSVYHGPFGRTTLYELNRPMTTHAHREGQPDRRDRHQQGDPRPEQDPRQDVPPERVLPEEMGRAGGS